MRKGEKMKTRIRTLIVISAAFLVTTAIGVFAQLRKGNYAPATLGQLAQAARSDGAPDSEYSVGAYPLYPPELDAGDGKAETEAYCSMCHSTRYITMQPPLPGATWEAEVTKMKKTFGATIPDEATSKILRYLKEHYTPETRKR
jgi:hypothetical protein